jgi:creatinine amidohydrolase/Fe(II)-dependent formamide hydrolase-like protein
MMPMINMSLSPYYSIKMTWGEIHDLLIVTPAIILPLGQTEPCTEFGTMGASALSCFALANKLSEKKKMLLSPIIPFGYSIAFRTFDGCGTLAAKTLTALLIDLLKSWVSQHIFTFIILNSISDNNCMVNEATQRIISRNPETRFCILNWHQMSEVRSFIASACSGNEYGRSEYGILSMAAYLDRSFVRQPSSPKKNNVIADQKAYQRWQKTGRDPEKFRKLFPDSQTSSIAHKFNAQFGQELFFHISDKFEKTLKLELNI